MESAKGPAMQAGIRNPADVASFFVTLGQAGYLQNTVVVNLLEIPS